MSFHIASVTLPTQKPGGRVTLIRRGPSILESLDPIIGHAMYGNEAYELTVQDVGTILIRDTGDIHTGASWSALINDQSYWFYEGEGEMNITFSNDGTATVAGNVNTVKVSLLVPGEQPVGNPVQPQSVTDFMRSVPKLAGQLPGLVESLVKNNQSLLASLQTRMPGASSAILGVSTPDDQTKALIGQLSNTPEMAQLRDVAQNSTEMALKTIQVGFSLGLEALVAGWVSSGYVLNLQLLDGRQEMCLFVSAGYGVAGNVSAALAIEVGFNSSTIPETGGWSSVFGAEGGEVVVGSLSYVLQSGGQRCLSAGVGSGLSVSPISGQGHYAYTWLSGTWMNQLQALP